MNSTKGLTIQARYLRNAAPEQFVRFVEEFKLYSAQTTAHMLYATENLPNVQGQAQQCLKLVEALEEVLKND